MKQASPQPNTAKQICAAVSCAVRPGSISRMLAERYGLQHFEFFPREVWPFSDVTNAPAHWSPGSEAPVSLADRDAEVTRFEAYRFGTRVAAPELVRLRKADTLFDERCPVDVLHVASFHFDEVIRGAASLIKRDQPLVLVDSTDWSPETRMGHIASLAGCLSVLGYRLFDTRLEYLKDDASIRQSIDQMGELLFFGMPPEMSDKSGLLLKALFPGRKGRQVKYVREDLQRKIDLVGFVCGANEDTALSQTFRFDETLECEGFFPSENDEQGSTWRWLGPRPTGRFWLPCPMPGSYQLALTVIGSTSEENLDDLRLFVDGRQLQVNHIMVDGAKQVIANIDLPWEPIRSRLEFVIACPKPLQPNHDDPRQLSVCISGCSLSKTAVE